MQTSFNDVERIFVPHTALQTIINRVALIYKASAECRDPVGMAVIGESRTGKSRLFEHIVSKYPPSRDATGIKAPLICIKAPSKPTVKALCEALLKGLGDPLWHNRDSETLKTARLLLLLQHAQCRLLVIDEFQHFYDKVTTKVQHHVSDWLKVLIDDAAISLIVVGLPSSMQVIDQNEQLRGRFTCVMHMHRFRWDDERSRNEFIAILQAMRKGLQQYEMPDLHNREIAFRFYCASGGLIGYVSKILKEATWQANTENSTIITMQALAIAYENALWRDRIATPLNPFDLRFDTKPTAQMLYQASLVGEPTIEDFAEKSKSVRNKPRAISASAVLRK